MLKRKMFFLLAVALILTIVAAQCTTPPTVEEKIVVQTVEVIQTVEVAAVEELPISLEEFTNAKINWRAPVEAAGEDPISLHIAMNKHPFTESLVPLIPIFEELTGIKVLYDILPEMEYYSKLAVDMSSGGGFIDVFMTGPEMTWQYIPPGWIEPLDEYLNNPELTDLEWYDPDDFYEAAWKSQKWDGKTLGHGVYGEGPLYGIPVTFEIMSLTYRTDLFEEAGITVDEGWPHTWEDIYTACKATTKDTDGDGEVDQYGIVSRGATTWASTFGGYSNIFFSYGATDFDENMKPATASEQGIAATELWAKILRECAPPGITDLQWFQAKQAFASGQAAMIIDCDWFSAATFEHPDRSEVAGKLGYALSPAGPDGQRVQDLWFWGLGINPKGYHKDAAWLFMQWATSKPVLLKATTDYQNWNPARQSVWEHPDVVKMSETWGNGAFRNVVTKNRDYAQIPFAVSPYLFTTQEAWWRNVQDIILGNVTAEEGLQNADTEMYQILEETGVYDAGE